MNEFSYAQWKRNITIGCILFTLAFALLLLWGDPFSILIGWLGNQTGLLLALNRVRAAKGKLSNKNFFYAVSAISLAGLMFVLCLSTL